jgi:hypothetical protein
VRLPSLNTMLTHDAKPTGSTLLSTTLPLSRCSRTDARPTVDRSSQAPASHLSAPDCEPLLPFSWPTCGQQKRPDCQSDRHQFPVSLAPDVATPPSSLPAAHRSPESLASECRPLRWAPEQSTTPIRIGATFPQKPRILTAPAGLSERGVEMGGFEPPTSRVQGGRSPTELHPQLRWVAMTRAACGSANGSHSIFMPVARNTHLVGQPGIEPGTSVLSGLRSNRLSYWPKGAAPGPEHERRAPLPAREDTRGDTQAPTAWTPEGGRSITTRTGSARTSTSEE